MPRQRRGLQTSWIHAASNLTRGTHQPTTSPAVAACGYARNQALAYQQQSASDAKLAVASHDLSTRTNTEVAERDRVGADAGPAYRMLALLPESRPHVAMPTPTHSDRCGGELLAWGAETATDGRGETPRHVCRELTRLSRGADLVRVNCGHASKSEQLLRL
jgi:hypothetical protein